MDRGRAPNGIGHLTHWGRDKMAATSQMTLSIAFSWMKMLEFRLNFHWSLFLRVQLKYSTIGSDNGLAPSRRQAIIWTNGGIVYWRIYASLGLNELMILLFTFPSPNLSRCPNLTSSTKLAKGFHCWLVEMLMWRKWFSGRLGSTHKNSQDDAHGFDAPACVPLSSRWKLVNQRWWNIHPVKWGRFGHGVSIVPVAQIEWNTWICSSKIQFWSTSCCRNRIPPIPGTDRGDEQCAVFQLSWKPGRRRFLLFLFCASCFFFHYSLPRQGTPLANAIRFVRRSVIGQLSCRTVWQAALVLGR